MQAIAILFLGVFLIIVGLEYFGLSFAVNRIAKGICLTVAGVLLIISSV